MSESYIGLRMASDRHDRDVWVISEISRSGFTPRWEYGSWTSAREAEAKLKELREAGVLR